MNSSIDKGIPLMRIPKDKHNKVYIAGPGVFGPNQKQESEHFKQLLINKGYEPLYPLDNCFENPTSKQIVEGNIDLINEADIIIADVNPFRGKEPDSGTCFEIGYGAAKGKTIYCYCNNCKPLVEQYGLIDENNYSYEDFGFPVNIMIAESSTIIEGTFEDVVNQLPKLEE